MEILTTSAHKKLNLKCKQNCQIYLSDYEKKHVKFNDISA